MPASITIESIGPENTIHLGETFIPDDPTTLGNGQEVVVIVRNSGDTTLRDITVEAEGESAEHIQLSVDVDGEPAQWTDVGGSIILPTTVAPGELVRFWARASYTHGDAEGQFDGEFVIAAVSV